MTSTYTASGETFLLYIGTFYNYTNSQGYLVSISKAYRQGKITLLSGQQNDSVEPISDIALYLESDNSITVWVYYNTTSANTCYCELLQRSNKSSTSLHNFTSGTPSGTQIGYAVFTRDITRNAYYGTTDLPSNYNQPGDVWYKLI